MKDSYDINEIVHFSRFDGNEVTAGIVVGHVPTKRLVLQTIGIGSLQINDKRIVRKVTGPFCWRCWNTRRVHAKNAKKFFDCPACKYRTNHDMAFKKEIESYEK